MFTFQNYNVFVCFFIDERTRHYTANVLKHCLTAIQEWWKAMNYDSPYIVSSIHLCICLKEFDVNDNIIIYLFISKLQSDDKKFSFHYPLHRYFSVFLRQAVEYQGFALKEGMCF